MSKHKSMSYKKKETMNYLLIPLLVVMLVVPLMTRLYPYDPKLNHYTWFTDSTLEVDIFLFWKTVILIVSAVVMGVVLAIRFKKEHISLKSDLWILLLAGYGVLTLVSTLVSPYRSYGFSGIYEQFESVWVILSYCVISIYAYFIVRKNEDLLAIRKGLFCLMTVMGLLGLTQVFGMDFFETGLGRTLIVPGQYASARDKLAFTFSDSEINQVYLTLYNPNYVGVFAALLLPILTFIVFVAEKKSYRILWGMLVVVLIVCTFGSGSKTFILSLGAILVVAIAFCRKMIVRYYKVVVPAIILLVVGGFAFFSVKDISLIKYLKNAIVVEKNDYALSNFEGRADSFVITYNDADLHVRYEDVDGNMQFLFSDAVGNLLESKINTNGSQQVLGERFRDIIFDLIPMEGGTYSYYATATMYNGPIMFIKTEDGYHYVNMCGNVAENVFAETAVFTDYDHFISRRGYIWSRSIPLLKDSVVLGTGADSFALVYPHDDYVGRYNIKHYNELITKPHNMYLQIGVQHGCVALVCYLAVCVIYFIQCCKLYWKLDLSNKQALLGVGIMLGIIGYLVAGLANDSSVTVAPLFWAWLGIGFAVNRMNKTEK